MHNLKKFFKILGYITGAILLLLIGVVIYVVVVSKVDPPQISNQQILKAKRERIAPQFYALNNSWIHKSKSGLYEMYVEGNSPFDLGATNGLLSKELVIKQEEHFAEQISKIVPSQSKRNFLKYLIGWFNRNLDKNIKEEYKEEIYGVSESASPNFQYLGTNYQRILNYHAAHDIGHALQNLALVGCTSFGTWGAQSEDSNMIIGRNFDFYAGDKFAEDKIVAFINPANGYQFVSITWGGFIGVVSGMNEKGLTVTINAAKSEYPTSSATPVSIVTREILQYAKNINEAIAIAKSRKMFVSESFLVSSATDHKAVIIEKTPEDLDVYDPKSDAILCTNHFQSKKLGALKINAQQIDESASSYRYKRLQQLLKTNGKNSVVKTIKILRDIKGIDNADIGMGNEKAINQLMAHHSIVFMPNQLKLWISTSPWQLGEYVCYDLNKVFKLKGVKNNIEIADTSLNIKPDSLLYTSSFQSFMKYRGDKVKIENGGFVNADSLIATNPQLYSTYILAGDEYARKKDNAKAIVYYQLALTKEIATQNERKEIQKKIDKLQHH